LSWDVQTLAGVSYGNYFQGRLAEMRHGQPGCSGGQIAEQFIWWASGTVAYKRLQVIKSGAAEGRLDAQYGYDGEGRMISEK
jgi:hypothetical protein